MSLCDMCRNQDKNKSGSCKFELAGCVLSFRDDGQEIYECTRFEEKESTKSLVGKVSICGKRLGVITERMGLSWIGVGFDGKKWASRDPEIIADSIDDYHRRLGLLDEYENK
jgi:hypothetical protein